MNEFRQVSLDARRLRMHDSRVVIQSINHKALRRFVETGNAKGLDAQLVGRLRKMVAFLTAMEAVEELMVPPNWGAHELKGRREGTWSLVVTKNWRLTFRVDGKSILDMNLEDYH